MTTTQIMILAVLVVAIFGIGWTPQLADNARRGFQIGLGILAAILLAYFLLGHRGVVVRGSLDKEAPAIRLANAQNTLPIIS
jgi:hypothetical protein